MSLPTVSGSQLDTALFASTTRRIWNMQQVWDNYGHFTHKPRAMTMDLWEPKRKGRKAIPRHLQNHVMWSRILNYSVKSFVTRPSTIWYFKEFLFMRVLAHDGIERINGCEHLECHGLLVLRWFFENSPSDHKTWFIRYHVGIYVDFTSILQSHSHLVPQA